MIVLVEGVKQETVEIVMLGSYPPTFNRLGCKLLDVAEPME
jgi:hypothetical protein